MEFIMNLAASAPDWLVAIAGVVTAAGAIAAFTPTKVDDKVLNGMGKLINILLRIVNTAGLNFGAAKNKDDK